jgi:methionyl-tRNA formyltransferase
MVKIIFFGTPDYVIPIVELLHKHYKVVAVVTQEPKLVGRKQEQKFSAVDNWAYKHKLRIIRDWKEELPEATLGVCASFGKIIPDKVLNHFPNGILNVHPSLLPKYRGASPIQNQIIDNAKETGISIIKMDSKMDHGPIVSQLKDVIEANDTNETLRNRLFERSAQFLIELIPNYLNGRIPLKAQTEDEATFTKILTRDDGFVDLEKMNASEVERRFRALNPWPGIFTKVKIDGRKMRLKILGLHVEEDKLVIDKVQLEGKKAVSFEEFKRGYPDVNI